MPDLIIPNLKPAAAQYEVRCPSFTAFNNLGIWPEIVGKYSMNIARVLEPQDGNGNQVGERRPLPDVIIPDIIQLAAFQYQLRDGTKLTVAQILEAVNLFVDAHKGENINSNI